MPGFVGGSMSREIPGFVAKEGSWMIRAKDGVDGLLILEPRPDYHLATLTRRTWRDLPDDPAAFKRFNEALDPMPIT
jgi:hypothetical protein